MWCGSGGGVWGFGAQRWGKALRLSGLPPLMRPSRDRQMGLREERRHWGRFDGWGYDVAAASTSSWALPLLFVNRRFYTWRIKTTNQERVIISQCLSLFCALSQGPRLKIAQFCYDSGIMISVSSVTAAQVFSNPSPPPPHSLSRNPLIKSFVLLLRVPRVGCLLPGVPRQSPPHTPRWAPGVELWSEKVIKCG